MTGEGKSALKQYQSWICGEELDFRASWIVYCEADYSWSGWQISDDQEVTKMEAHAATEAMLSFQAKAEHFSCFPHALLAVHNTFKKKKKKTHSQI